MIRIVTNQFENLQKQYAIPIIQLISDMNADL